LRSLSAAAAQAQKAAEAAHIEADRARKAVDDAVREINRVSDHVDQINRDRAAAGD
jgi:methyl-accepting chemotaxis protein